MSTYSLTDETSIDVLIFWVESADGSISFAEQTAVKRVLENMKYDLSTYHKTLSHLGSMSTSNLHTIVDEAISHIKSHFSDDGKNLVYSLLESIANCDSNISKAEQEKLSRIKSELGI
ncbi:MAG: TerB family tellurite resistance protein [Balneolaceae bacterium]|nr:TerB family tellurite resistance protein [Balneolaceae bacterium]